MHRSVCLSAFAALVLAMVVSVGCGSDAGPPAPPPAAGAPGAPAQPSATPGPGQVALSWPAVANATAYRVYFNLDAAGALSPMSSPSADAAGATDIVVPNLQNGARYRFAVTARNDAGESPLSPEAWATPDVATALAVVSTTPSDGASFVPTNTSIAVAFNHAALPSSIDASTSGSACSGVVQLSSDDFATCVPMADVPAPSAGNKVFTASPASALAAGTRYKIRVTTGARDAGGSRLDAAYTSRNGFVTDTPFAVASTSPSDGAIGIARTTSVAVTFAKAANPATITSTSGTACTGSFQVSSDAFATCVAMSAAPVASNGNTTFTVTPAAPLADATTYRVRVTTAAQDANGMPLPAAFTTPAGFFVGTSFAVASTSPADASTGVATNASVSITFSQAALPSSIVASTSTSCTGSLQLSVDGFATCVALGAPVASNANRTFTVTPVAPLGSGATYRARVTTAARDASSNALGADFTMPTGFTTTAPPDVTAATATTALQSVALAWTNPTNADFAFVRVYVRPVGGTFALAGQTSSPSQSSFTVSGLLPNRAYDFKLATVTTLANESAGNLALANVRTAFTGGAIDFVAGQTVTALNGAKVRFTWTDTELFAAASTAADARVLNPGDALWIAVDTDPLGNDAHGEARTATASGTDVTWPFKTDWIVELKVTSVGVAVTNLRNVATTSWAPLATAAYEAPVDEVRVARADIGSPTSARLAFALVTTTTGNTFDLAPANPSATDVTGSFASLAASFAPAASAWRTSTTATSATAGVSPVVGAPSLVKLTVNRGAATGAMKVRGNVHPLSYTLTDSTYALRDDGTHGDATASDGVFTGAFNLGGFAGELFFQFADAGVAEPIFAAGHDRVYTLAGSTMMDALPTPTWNVAWGASHSFSLAFRCTTGGTPTELRGSVAELGSFTAAGAAVAGMNPTTATVTFANHDFVSTPLEFKIYYANATYEGGTNHAMNDDVMNTRVLAWTAGDSTSF